MSPKRQPQTLYDLSLNETVSLVMKTCENIESHYGDFKEERCRQSVQYIQEFFLNNVPVTVFDDIYQRWKHTSCNSLMCRNDTRINYAFFLHTHLKTFHAQRRPTFNMLDEPIHAFWVNQLARLTHITDLNLDFVCTDNILKVVGVNCLYLIRIKIRSGKNKCGNWKKNVTDTGLSYLSQCVTLREVRMDLKETMTAHKMRAITEDGIRSLVSSLPNLIYINYNDMGTILNQKIHGKNELALRKIDQDECRLDHVKNVLRLCPYLHSLTLWSADLDSKERTGILETLTNSKLKLTNITLGDFKFDQVMRDFLEIKGGSLKMLHLNMKRVASVFEESTEVNLKLEDLLHIGICCPKLKALTLDANFSRWQHPPRLTKRLFTHLESLSVCGNWHKHLLPTILKHSPYIGSIFMDGAYDAIHDGDDSSFNAVFHNLLAEVPVASLAKVIVMQKTSFSSESVNLRTIRYLIGQCPSLTIVCLNMLIDGGYKGQMNYEVKMNNLDLRLVFDTNNYQSQDY